MHRPQRFHGFISERNELLWSHHAPAILSKYVSLFQACCCSVFRRILPKDLLVPAGEMLVVLICDICNAYEIVAYDWLYSHYWGPIKILDMASKFLGNIEDWCLFSVLVKLIWLGKTAELSKSVLSNFKRMSWYHPLMYGSKPCIQECIFYRSRPTKMKSLYIGPSHAGASYSY